MASRSTTRDAIWNVLSVMRESATAPIASPARSMGLIGGEAAALSKLEAKTDSGTANARIADPMLARATTYAMAVLETNASMGRALSRPSQPVLRASPAMLFSGAR